MVDLELCTGCGLCADECIKGLLVIQDGKMHMREGPCLSCGHCEAVCPTHAIFFPGEDPADIIEYDAETFSVPATRLLNLMRFRRSVRRFRKEALSKETIEQLLQAGRYAPTGANRQKLRYLVLEERLPEIRDCVLRTLNDVAQDAGKYPQMRPLLSYQKKWESMYREFQEQGKDRLFHGAACVILTICQRPEECTGELDAGLASAYMELMAHTMGLGCCFIGFLTMAIKADPGIRDILGLKPDEHVISALAVGVPDVRYHRTVNRKKCSYSVE